jgi:excisionase family DNA binding protein
MTDERYLSVDESAEYLGVSKKSIYRWSSERKLKHYKLGGKNAYLKKDLDRFAERNVVEAMSY